MAATKVAEEEVEAFLSDLRAGDVDKKINLIQHWGLKLEGVDELPERTVDAITLLVGPFVRSSAHLLVSSTLTGFLPPFLLLVPSAPAQSHLRLAMSCMLPGIIEKLNDPKDKFHIPARECLALLGGKAYASESLASSQAGSSRGKEKDGVVSQWETAVKDALSGRGARAKVEALKLLLQMRNDPSVKLPLKPWLPSLVNLLEDGDGAVRDQARETTVALLSPSSTAPAARAEFKKLMLAKNVRKSIADGILFRILGGGGEPSTPSVWQGELGSAESTCAPTPANEDVEIVYIASARDLDSEFKAMIPHFAGKETEHNWGPRERAILRIRGMLRGQVFAKQPDAFLVGLKSGIVDGVSRTLLSLRTTVSQQSCALVQELSEYLGPAFDPSVELLLPTLGKMAGLTKRMIADRSQQAVTAIIKHSTVHPRVLVGHIGAAIADKSVQTRQHGATHLKTLLETPAARNLATQDPTLVDQMEQMLKRCLADINPLVREKGRTTFWSFERLFPQPAATILDSLDGTAKKQLERANQRLGNETASAVTTKATPKPRASSAMSAMIAAKRAKAAAKRADAAAVPAPDSAPNQHDGAPSAPQPSGEVGVLPKAPPSPVPHVESPPARPRPNTEAQSIPATPRTPQTPTRLPRPPASATSHAVSPQPPDSPTLSSPTISKLSSNKKRMPRLPLEIKRASDDSRLPNSRLSPRSSQNPIPLPSPNGKSSISPVSRVSALPRPISAVISGASSDVSGRSRSSSLARTLSRSPPAESPLQALSVLGGNAASGGRRTSAPFHNAQGSAASRSMAASRSRPTQQSLEEHSYFSQQDPAEEARHAQALQGLSAAKQLLEFDDDDANIPTAPMTPMRTLRGNNVVAIAPMRAPLHGFEQRIEWDDSPMPMTPKLIHKLEHSGLQRSWWTARRKLLHEATIVDSARNSGIEADVAALGQPAVVNLQRIARFSSDNPISVDGDAEGDSKRAVWEKTRIFDRILDGLLSAIDPSQPANILEQALVTLWELVQNQWALFESREDSLLDRLLLLRLSSDHTVLESTNALVSLLVEVCNPPFLLSQLESALERFLATHQGDTDSPESARVRTAGYTYALNAMGMCILKLPKEAVEGEAKRRSHLVVQALDHDLAVSSRQAGNRVILAVQCMLQDDTRTLGVFPGLTSTQRDFATYQMSQSGLLTKATDENEVSRRESLHSQLVDGLAKGSRVR